jgi:hypothetical protein
MPDNSIIVAQCFMKVSVGKSLAVGMILAMNNQYASNVQRSCRVPNIGVIDAKFSDRSVKLYFPDPTAFIGHVKTVHETYSITGRLQPSDRTANVAATSSTGPVIVSTPVSSDDVARVASYRQKCSDGDLQGCVNLATMYRMGWGVNKDLSEANSLYKSACDAGSSTACDHIAATSPAIPVTAPTPPTTTLVFTPVNRQAFVKDFDDGYRKQGVVAYADFAGDVITIHSERCSALRFHAELTNEKMITAFKQMGFTTLIYTNDTDQKFTYDLTTGTIGTVSGSTVAASAVPVSAPTPQK